MPVTLTVWVSLSKCKCPATTTWCAYIFLCLQVIIELSVRSADVSKTLIDRLLRQNHRDILMINSQCMATDATAEILYRIGLHHDSNAATR